MWSRSLNVVWTGKAQEVPSCMVWHSSFYGVWENLNIKAFDMPRTRPFSQPNTNHYTLYTHVISGKSNNPICQPSQKVHTLTSALPCAVRQSWSCIPLCENAANIRLGISFILKPYQKCLPVFGTVCYLLQISPCEDSSSVSLLFFFWGTSD